MAPARQRKQCRFESEFFGGRILQGRAGGLFEARFISQSAERAIIGLLPDQSRVIDPSIWNGGIEANDRCRAIRVSEGPLFRWKTAPARTRALPCVSAAPPCLGAVR